MDYEPDDRRTFDELRARLVPKGDEKYVHHLDGNPYNNDIDNLVVMSARDRPGFDNLGDKV